MSNLVVNKDMNIVLQPTKQLLLCKDLLGYETNEGLFIIGNDNVYKTLLAKDDPGKFLDLIVKVASGATAVELSNETSGIIRLIRVNLSPSLISKSFDWI